MVAYFAGMMLTCFGLGCKETASVVIFAPSSAEVCDFSDLLELGRICPLDRRGAPPGDIFVPLPERFSYLPIHCSLRVLCLLQGRHPGFF